MRIATTVVASLALAVSAGVASAQLVNYTFNNTGTTEPNVGTLGSSANLNLRVGPNGPATDLHGPVGSGVGGGRALNFTSATGMGNQATGTSPYSTAGDVDGLDGLSAFTVTGFFRTDGTAAIGNAARLFSKLDAGQPGGYQLLSDFSGRLDFQVFDSAISGTFGASSDVVYTETQEYVFFALTYNASGDGSDVTFYKGTTTTPVTLAGGGRVNDITTIPGSTAPLLVGNRLDGARPFDGFIDEFRIYGSALNAAQIEAIRVSAIPEPTSLAAAGLIGGLLLRRRQHA